MTTSESLARYRRLEHELVRIRWKNAGEPSLEEDALVQEMEVVWDDLGDEEQGLLDQEPPRSLILANLSGEQLVYTAEPPSPERLLSVALRHTGEMKELLALASPASPAQAQYLERFGPACARRAVLACGDVFSRYGGEITDKGLERVLMMDPVAHQLDPGSHLDGGMTGAQDIVDEVAVDLLSAGRVSKEDVLC